MLFMYLPWPCDLEIITYDNSDQPKSVFSQQSVDDMLGSWKKPMIFQRGGGKNTIVLFLHAGSTQRSIPFFMQWNIWASWWNRFEFNSSRSVHGWIRLWLTIYGILVFPLWWIWARWPEGIWKKHQVIPKNHAYVHL